MNESDEVWRWMSQIIQKLIQWKKCSYLAVTNDVWLNQQNDEWGWFSMKVSASKICHESNYTNDAFN